MSNQAAVGKSLESADAGRVLIKLVVFSLSLGILPLLSYFASRRYLWEGNSTYAAITAVVSANVVLVAYIVTSILEDRQTPLVMSEKTPQDQKKRQ